MFKKGDKVKFIGTDGYSYTNGHIYEVREYPSKYGHIGTVLDDEGSTTNGISAKLFELVEQKVTTNEELVETANKCKNAILELKSRGIIVEQKGHGTENWYVLSNCWTGSEYRISKKEFKSFVIGKNWNVRMFKGLLHVGCKQFGPEFLLKDLNSFINLNVTYGIYNTNCSATKNGIRLDECSDTSYLLSWEDVEKLYKALKEYLNA